MSDKESATTYSVRNMRPVITTGKVKVNNPDRILTVHGDFWNVDDKGKPTGEMLTFHSKEITQEIAANPLTVIDVANGILTLPAGDRGRKALVGVDSDTVLALLAAAREPIVEAAAEAPAVETPAAE